MLHLDAWKSEICIFITDHDSRKKVPLYNKKLFLDVFRCSLRMPVQYPIQPLFWWTCAIRTGAVIGKHSEPQNRHFVKSATPFTMLCRGNIVTLCVCQCASQSAANVLFHQCEMSKIKVAVDRVESLQIWTVMKMSLWIWHRQISNYWVPTSFYWTLYTCHQKWEGNDVLLMSQYISFASTLFMWLVHNKWRNLIIFCQIKEKKEEIWLSPMIKAPTVTPTEKSKKQRDNIKSATINFDYTTIADLGQRSCVVQIPRRQTVHIFYFFSETAPQILTDLKAVSS